VARRRQEVGVQRVLIGPVPLLRAPLGSRVGRAQPAGLVVDELGEVCLRHAHHALEDEQHEALGPEPGVVTKEAGDVALAADEVDGLGADVEAYDVAGAEGEFGSPEELGVAGEEEKGVCDAGDELGDVWRLLAARAEDEDQGKDDDDDDDEDRNGASLLPHLGESGELIDSRHSRTDYRVS